MEKIFCFLTGVFFSFMQFGFLLSLQINVSSTYLTYALVTICWMAGILAGLWTTKFRPVHLMLFQPIAYFFSYYLVTSAPFSSLTFPVAAIAITGSGLWAGRFFPEMFSSIQRADSLLFHENNGFILGAVAFFIGFTMLGRPFLVYSPLIMSLILLCMYVFIFKRKKETEVNIAEPTINIMPDVMNRQNPKKN